MPSPPDLRDAIPTIREVVTRAREKRGRVAGAIAAAGEWVSLALAVVRQKSGRRARITTGRTPKPPRSGEPFMVKLLHDARHAWRSLLATRAVVALAVFTLALGIGVNTAVFSVLDSLLFRSVPYADSERLATIWTFYGAGKFVIKGGFSPAMATRWRQETDLFARLEASQMKSFIYDGQSGADMVAGAVVTPGLFPMLGVGATAGRLFDQSEGRAGSDHVAIVSDRFWRERLGRDRSAIGRAIVLDSERYVVIGVMPATFRFPTAEHDVWLPFDIAQPPNDAAAFEIIARLQHGLARADAETKVEARGAEINRVAGGDGKSSARLRPLTNGFDERTTRSLAVLAGAVICLLLIVCANVANLTLARALGRSGDLAVRASLGASRADLFRVALVEHTLVGLAGGVLAIGVAQATVAAVAAVLPAQMTVGTLNAIDLDGRAFGWLAALSVLTVLVFGVPPAVMASRASVAGALRRASRATTTSRTGGRLRSTLVVVEVALCIVLLVGAALMTRSLLKLQAIDIGMDVNGLVAMQIALPAGGYADVAVRDAFTQDVVTRARQHPGVIHASAGTLPPTESMITFGPIEFGDRPGEKTKATYMSVYATWPAYFQTAGISLREGREFRDAEVEGAIIVSQGFAAKHWPGRSPLGATFQVGKGPWWSVVGVASEIHRLVEDDDSKEFELYLPHDQLKGVMFGVRIPASIAEYRTLMVRTSRPAQAARELAAVVHDVDPRVVVSKTTLVAHEFADSIARPRIVFLMMAVFAAVGLVLAAAGLYGVLSYLVSLRQHEIGIRIALGATARDVGRLVMSRGLSLVAIGLVVGLAAALALVRVMRTLLYEVEPTDPIAIVGVIALMAATAALAAWRPTRRAMRIDPVRLLRES